MLDDPLPSVDSPLEFDDAVFDVPPDVVIPEGSASPNLFARVLFGAVEFPRSSPKQTRNVVDIIAVKNDLIVVSPSAID